MKNVLSAKEINQITERIGTKISKDLAKEKQIPIVIGIMKGSLNFMMDLLKHIKVDVFTDYIQISSYNGTKSTGQVIFKRYPSFDLKNRTIVIVEDIIDTGISMNYLLEHIKEHYHPKKIILVALIDKRFRRKQKVNIDYVGKILNEDDFLCGYGLDYNELGRNFPNIYGLSKKEIENLDKKANQ